MATATMTETKTGRGNIAALNGGGLRAVVLSLRKATVSDNHAHTGGQNQVKGFFREPEFLTNAQQPLPVAAKE